jgi:hypothetical protein
MDENLARGLLTKCQDLNSDSHNHLDAVAQIIRQLTAYAEGQALEPPQLHNLINKLLVYTVLIPVPIPGISGTPFSRGVRYEGDDVKNYAKTDRLSYIPSTSGVTPRLNRLNQEGVSMFYGCLGGNANSIGAVLSECQAQAGDTFYLLYSRTKPTASDRIDAINVVPIGVFDYLRRGISIPFGLSNEYLHIYEVLRANTHPEGFLAMQLCDAFLTDILRRPSSPSVYSLTSAVANNCLSAPELDGFLYPSTKLDGHPNLALRPSVVDKRVRHESAMAVRVEHNFGYGIYATKQLSQGTVRGDVIDWG